MRRLLLLLLLVLPVRAEDIPPGQRLSGFETMGAEAQAMQRDDFANPAMLSVREGEALWSAAPAEGGPSCQSCHGGPATMRGVAARYPAFETRQGAAVDLAGRIRLCQQDRQGVAPAARESGALLALEALVALQSRGLPLAPPGDARLDAALARGRALYTTRFGQLDLACIHCHDRNRGKSLGGTIIPQGHPTGYPLFRMEWQATGSLHRRLRNCMAGVRAEPFPPGAPEMIDLELYLKHRAAGMMMDAPAVRP